jgi:hypothetical protein
MGGDYSSLKGIEEGGIGQGRTNLASFSSLCHPDWPCPGAGNRKSPLGQERE